MYSYGGRLKFKLVTYYFCVKISVDFLVLNRISTIFSTSILRNFKKYFLGNVEFSALFPDSIQGNILALYYPLYIYMLYLLFIICYNLCVFTCVRNNS